MASLWVIFVWLVDQWAVFLASLVVVWVGGCLVWWLGGWQFFLFDLVYLLFDGWFGAVGLVWCLFSWLFGWLFFFV